MMRSRDPRRVKFSQNNLLSRGIKADIVVGFMPASEIPAERRFVLGVAS